ncbi:MAG: hypothetical protein ACXADL_11265 [Candidatus Thorarchaeota archaeon]|jgi:hypothetical protein
MSRITRDEAFFPRWNRHRRNYFIKLTFIVCAAYATWLVILIEYLDSIVILISMLVVLVMIFLLAVYLVISNPPKHSSLEEQKVQNAPTT